MVWYQIALYPSGNPTGEEAYNYEPKSYVVVGSLEQFVGDNGVNEEQPSIV